MALGRISIKVFPDTSKFRTDLKTALNRIERNTRGTVQIIPVIDREALARLKNNLSRLNATAKVRVDADTAAASRRLSDIARGRKATVEADLDTKAATEQLKTLFNRKNLVVNVEPETTGARRALTALTRALTAPITAEVETAKAAARLAELSAADPPPSTPTQTPPRQSTT